MSSADLAGFWVHTVTVEPRAGNGPTGPIFGTAVPIACFWDDTSRLIRGANGETVVASGAVLADVALAPSLTVNSRLTLPDGRRTFILSRDVHTSGTLDLPDHVEVMYG